MAAESQERRTGNSEVEFMPTYEYECRACGEKVEYFQRISEPVKTECPVCGKPELVRLMGTGAGFIFKGSGFYATDYRSSDYKARAKADSGTPSDKCSSADKCPSAKKCPAGGK